MMPNTEKSTKQKLTWRGVLLMALLLAAALVLSGCAEPPAISAVQPTPTRYEPPPTDIPAPPPGPTPAALNFPLPPQGEAEIEAPPDDGACIDCHTNQDILMALAETENESEENLSEGEG